MMRHWADDGSYLEHELYPRRALADGRLVEACCRIRTGPAAYPTHVFEPTALTAIGWALLSASHRLARLQGSVPLEAEDDPQLTIYDILEEAR